MRQMVFLYNQKQRIMQVYLRIRYSAYANTMVRSVGAPNTHCQKDLVGNMYALFMDSMIKYNQCNLNGR